MSNVFTNLSNNPSQKTALAATNAISDLARGQAGSVLNSNGQVIQTERLFSARARYALAATATTSSAYSDASRGSWAYIKLLTSQTQQAEYQSGSTKRQLSSPDLIGPGSIAATMADPDGTKGYGYDKFLITGVSCDMNEKVQISQVFGDNEVVYYFGRQPLIFSIRGVLIDSLDNDWFTTWIKTYSDFLRGSQSARNYELIKIVLPNMAITGSITGFSYNQDSSRDVDIPFSMQFIAKVVEPLPINNSNVVNINNLSGVDFSKVNTFVPQSAINDLKGQQNTLNNVLANPGSSLQDRATALSQYGSGVGGLFGNYLQTTNDSIQGFQSTISGWNSQENAVFGSIQTSALFQTVNSSLTGIRTNLFSPIYGVMSSLTKLVLNTSNSASSLFNSLINPVRNILRDITNISTEAISIVNLVNNSITGFGRNVSSQLKGTQSDYKTAIQTLGIAAGTVALAPISAANSAKNMFSDGYIDVYSPFLSSTGRVPFVRPSLTITKNPPLAKVAILTSTPDQTAQNSNSL